MANLSKIKRDEMIAFLDELKKTHSDDASIRAFNMIENHLCEKKYGLVWEEHSEEVDEMLEENIPVLTADPERRLCKDESLPWNFIIEGDNLQALYLLEKTHRGKVDCIYIDPPYNTGAKDWKYNNDYVDGNDVYRHSKWLSMMKNRLLLAKHLLDPDNSVLIVTIDEKEYLRLGCLLEELFPTANIQMISSMISRKGAARTNEFTRVNEFIYFVMIGDCSITPCDSAEYALEGEPIHWQSFRRSSAANVRTSRPSQFYPIYVDRTTNRIVKVGDAIPHHVDRFSVEQLPNCDAVFPVRDDGSEMLWGITPEVCRERVTKGYVRASRRTPDKPQLYVMQYLMSGTIDDINKGRISITGYAEDGSVIAQNLKTRKIMPRTQWSFDTHDARDHGTKILKNILKEIRFDFPKSLYAVRDSLKYFLIDKPDAIVVDFFSGSGTTGHAVNLLNAEYGGHRRFIMVTNNEISEMEEKDFLSRGIKKGDIEWEERGIAKYVTWPRTVCTINGVDIEGKALIGKYLDKDIPMANGFKANVKYFKCDWTPRKPEDYLLSNALCLHIREMIELQNAIEVDNVKNVLILNKSDLKKTVLNPEIYSQIQNVWVNQNIIFNAEELRLLEAKGYKYIPREFFGQELREAAE